MTKQKNDAMGMFKKINSVKPASKKKEGQESKAEEKIIQESVENKEENAVDLKIQEKPVTEEPEPEVADPKIKETSKPAPKRNSGKVVTTTMDNGKKKEKKSQRTFYMKDSLFEKLKKGAADNEAGISEFLGFILEQVL